MIYVRIIAAARARVPTIDDWCSLVGLMDAAFDRLLVVLADGARPDVIEHLTRTGEMPVFKRHFIDVGGFRSATSVRTTPPRRPR